MDRKHQLHSIPPSHWDELAMEWARQLVQEMEEVNHPKAMLIARIHCLLIDAMEWAVSDKATRHG